MSNRIFIVGMSTLLLIHAGGCNSSPTLPPTAPVTGTITLEGAPLPDAQVQFVPAPGTEGPPALAFTDASGRYELETAGVKGAIVGSHLVRIEARAKPKDETDTLPMLLTPERYADTATSGLTATVEAQKSNEINFNLTRTPPQP